MRVTRLSVCLFVLLGAAAMVHAVDFTRDLKLTQSRMNGPDVTEVQKRLLSLGFAEVGTADGWFGPKTETAVKRYQELLGFAPSGVVNKALWQVMFQGTGLLGKLHADVKLIASLTPASYSRKESDLSGYSAEGGSLVKYTDKGALKMAEIDLMGEMGKVSYRVYPMEDRYVVTETRYSYPEPFDLEHAEVDYTAYYYQKGKTYQVKDGAFLDADYDAPGVLEMLKK